MNYFISIPWRDWHNMCLQCHPQNLGWKIEQHYSAHIYFGQGTVIIRFEDDAQKAQFLLTYF